MRDQQNNDGLSRRQALTRLGVGAAAVWSAPVVTGLTTPAAAAGSPPTSACSSCAPDDMTWFPACGTGCYCYPRVDGLGCFCGREPLDGTDACAEQADCSDGAVCVETFFGPICTQPCAPID